MSQLISYYCLLQTSSLAIYPSILPESRSTTHLTWIDDPVFTNNIQLNIAMVNYLINAAGGSETLNSALIHESVMNNEYKYKHN